MTMPSPNDRNPGPGPNSAPGGGRRMSTGIKLVLMGVAGAALLYSCAPGIGSGLGAMPYLWFFANPFFRGQTATAPQNTQLAPGTTTRPGGAVTTPGGTTAPHGATTPSGPSTRGGFGGSAGTHGTTSS
jgi:hypothetical protein